MSTMEQVLELALRLHKMTPEQAVSYLLKHAPGDTRTYRLAARQMVERHGGCYPEAWRMGAVLRGAARAVRGQASASPSSKPKSG
jgi:hypothetical protein